MSRIVLSESAREDRRDITAYTIERFGLGQARRLRHRFEAALSQLADAPLVGSTNKELDPLGRSCRYFVLMKSFVIAYEPTLQGIRVVRILHGARNLAAELQRDHGDETA